MAGADLTVPGDVTERDDVQALLRSGFGPLTEACFLLLRVADVVAARAWLARVHVTSMADLDTKQETVLQVALTAAGMRALGTDPKVIDGFSAEFVAGMAGDAARSRRLGDVGPDAPEHWDWGWAEREPHALVMLYAQPGALAVFREEVVGSIGAGFDVLTSLETSDMKGHEPFGFLDGVSQPSIDWNGERAPGSAADLDYGNLIAAGEFVLGYRNEYGRLTERPIVDGAQDERAAALLPRAADRPKAYDSGRNGTYLVLRQLEQDVPGFWRTMSAAAPANPIPLAEAVVGRRLDGSPLVPLQPQRIPGVGEDAGDRVRNQFTYTRDPQGLACPIGAHVRRANPRNGDMAEGRTGLVGQLLCTLGFAADTDADRIAPSRFHRLLRRGREYGRLLSIREAQASVEHPPAGIHFLCLNANISRQFEFVQNAWLQGTTFGGLTGEADPLTGNRAPLMTGAATDGFSMPQGGGVAKRVAALPRFVTVRGGGYFFLPGVRALRYLAG
jgi:deferrochelatase/peroxidase EfeB